MNFLKLLVKKNRNMLFLIIITIIGGYFRFYNLNWDQGHFFHPDERNIDMAVSRIHFFDQLNPGFFAYGGFIMYLYRLLGEILVFFTKNHSWTYDWGTINIIGRFFSGIFATTTIPLVYILAKKIFNEKTALLSATLTALTVSLIQAAHFSTTESILVLLAVLLCILSLMTLNKPILINYIFCGVVLGIATAAKTISISLILFMVAAQILILLKNWRHFIKNNLLFIVFLLTSFITFTIFSPYTFLNWDKFIESMKYESGVATGSLPVVYTLQFDKTLPYLFQMKNFFWQMGPLALFAIAGFIFLIIKMLLKKNNKLFIFLSFPLVYFIYVGYWHTKFIRYVDPLLPFLIIAGSYLLFLIINKFKTIGISLALSILIMTIFWAVAFFSIYTKEQTRITASKWIYKNIPIGSKILGEHWDDGLPISLTSKNPGIYNIEQLTIYEPDNGKKIDYYADKLSQANYIVINSRRLYGTLINLPEKYPITSKYYKLLFGSKLGYEKINELKSYPSFFGIEINDDLSEETFQVYDHPKILIYKNEKMFSYQTIKDIITK